MIFDINDFIHSLQDNRHDDEVPVVPDELHDFSEVVAPLSVITRYGRALHSDNEYGFADFISTLLREYLGEDPDSVDLQRCIAGLSILIVTVMRSIATIAPDWRAEELFLDYASQSEIRKCQDLLRTTPTSHTEGGLKPNFGQLPLFQRPIPLTQEALNGFIMRRIAPDFLISNNEETPHDSDNDSYHEPKKSFKVNLGDFESLEADPLNDFNEFYREFFRNEDEYLTENDFSENDDDDDNV